MNKLSEFTKLEQYVRDRITELRLQKGVTEYKMSYDLGHSKSYINNITARKALPSMGEFFAICDYFNITPIQFFDAEQKNPHLNSEIISLVNKLNIKDSELVLALIKRLLLQ